MVEVMGGEGERGRERKREKREERLEWNGWAEGLAMGPERKDGNMKERDGQVRMDG